MNRPLRHTSLIAALLILASTPALAAKAADTTGAIATVNGKPISKAKADLLINAQQAQGRPDSDDLRRAVKERLVMLEVVAQEAQKKGLDKKPEVQAQAELARQDVLINAYLADYVRSHPVSADAVKRAYDAETASLGDKEYKARHILVEKEEEAKDIIARLKKGDKFEDLAKQSKDPGSRDKGGDLDWSVPANYVKPFADALTKLQKGKFTETPVKTNFGWHVILLEDSRTFNPPALKEVEGQITQGLQRQMVDQHVQDLLKKAKID
ncbi:peptidylprolyl isomerase [Denitratisoma sp. agr-D3]